MTLYVGNRDYSVIICIYRIFIVQSFFGFGQSAEIDIYLDGQEHRKTAEVKTEDGKKEKLLLYYDGETVSGKVKIICNLHVFSGWSIIIVG